MLRVLYDLDRSLERPFLLVKVNAARPKGRTMYTLVDRFRDFADIQRVAPGAITDRPAQT